MRNQQGIQLFSMSAKPRYSSVVFFDFQQSSLRARIFIEHCLPACFADTICGSVSEFQAGLCSKQIHGQNSCFLFLISFVALVITQPHASAEASPILEGRTSFDVWQGADVWQGQRLANSDLYALYLACLICHFLMYHCSCPFTCQHISIRFSLLAACSFY